MEGGEFIVNKAAARNNMAELERINGKTSSRPKYFAAGGSVPVNTDSLNSDISTQILEALREPVRAYISDQDLAASESERKALTTKTSY